MFHLVAYSETVASAAEYDSTPVPDGIMTIQNGHFLPQRNFNLLAAYMGGLLTNYGKIVTPSIRQFSPAQIRPIDLVAQPQSRPGVADYRANPLLLRALEEISVVGINTAATSGVYSAALCLGVDALQPMPAGDVFTIRGTATTTLVVEGWTLLAVTWADTLPAGRYACVGLQAWAAGLRYARLIFEDQVWRPGCVGAATAAAIPHPMFSKGGMGLWGTFTGNRMPNVEMLSLSADTAETVYLDFVRIG
jgi:hypothetical protein